MDINRGSKPEYFLKSIISELLWSMPNYLCSNVPSKMNTARHQFLILMVSIFTISEKTYVQELSFRIAMCGNNLPLTVHEKNTFTAGTALAAPPIT